MTYLPTTLHQSPDYHWSPANQRHFLEQLATTGNISETAKSVAMSAQAAHAFRNRAVGAVFKLGWDAAILLARKRLEGDFLERALAGQEEIYEREPDTGKVRRIRSDNRLSMGMLHRLDKMATGKSDVPADTAMALIVSQDFESFLDLIERDGGRAEAMLFLKTRDGGLVPMVNVTREELLNNYQLAQNPAGFGKEDDEEVEPEAAASKMSVWFCDEVGDFRTDFPPPDNFDGEEEERFGDHGYERSLTGEEERIQLTAQAADLRPLRDAAEEARQRWFGGEAANEVRAELAAETLVREASSALQQAELAPTERAHAERAPSERTHAERAQAEQERAAVEAVALADAAPVAQLGAEIMPEAEPSEPEYDFAAAYQQDDPNVSLFYRNA